MTRYEDVQARLRANPRTWLITGAAGFIGSNLLEALLGYRPVPPVPRQRVFFGGHESRRVAALLLAGMLVSCGGGGDTTSATGGGNTTPPTVGITAPASGQFVSGSINVTATVAANFEVAGVQFQLDGANVGAEDTADPYSTTLDTTIASDGTHTLSAIARDTAGNLITSAPVTVMVGNTTPPPEPPVAGRAEETDAAVTLSTGWTPATPDWYARSGGSAVQSAVLLAKATYTFTGTSVTWIGQRSNVSGIARVKVAGRADVLVDLYAHNFETNSPVYTVNGLSPGSHTLTIEVTGTKNDDSQGFAVVVDAFAVPAPVLSHLQETDPDVVFTGVWAQADNNSGWSGGGLATDPAPPVGGARVTQTSGAKTILTFRGTAVSWVGYRGRDGGKASVTVDGGAATVVDTYSPSDKMQATVFTATGLADVPLPHTLTIEALGTHNVFSTASKIIVDAFDVRTPGRRYQEEDPAVVYSPGNWIWPNINRTWSEGAIAESSTAGASVTFTFTGTSVSWIGCRKLSTGTADIYVDGVLVKQVDTYLAPAPPGTLAVGTEAYQTTIYRVDNLAPAPALHTLKIVNTGNGSYTVIDAFDVRP